MLAPYFYTSAWFALLYFSFCDRANSVRGLGLLMENIHPLRAGVTLIHLVHPISQPLEQHWVVVGPQ